MLGLGSQQSYISPLCNTFVSGTGNTFLALFLGLVCLALAPKNPTSPLYATLLLLKLATLSYLLFVGLVC